MEDGDRGSTVGKVTVLIRNYSNASGTVTPVMLAIKVTLNSFDSPATPRLLISILWLSVVRLAPAALPATGAFSSKN